MKKEIIKKYFNYVVGTLIIAISFNIFFLNNNLAAFGVSGLSIIFKDLLDIDPSLFILIGNVILIILSYFVLDKTYTKRAIFGSLTFPLFIKLTAFIPSIFDISNTDIIATTLVGGLITGFGQGLVYKEGYSLGGTDVTNEIIHRFAKIPMGTAIAIGEGIVVLFGGIVFGFETMLLSLVVLVTSSIICNKIMLNRNSNKTIFIITSQKRKIRKLLINEFKTDITIMESIGGLKNNKNKILMTVIDIRKYFEIKKAIQNIDANAFITVTDSFEVVNQNKKIKVLN